MCPNMGIQFSHYWRDNHVMLTCTDHWFLSNFMSQNIDWLTDRQNWVFALSIFNVLSSRRLLSCIHFAVDEHTIVSLIDKIVRLHRASLTCCPPADFCSRSFMSRRTHDCFSDEQNGAFAWHGHHSIPWVRAVGKSNIHQVSRTIRICITSRRMRTLVMMSAAIVQHTDQK